MTKPFDSVCASCNEKCFESDLNEIIEPILISEDGNSSINFYLYICNTCYGEYNNEKK